MKNHQVVLVNQKDQTLGLENKLKAHQGKGKLHRAISVYLFNSQAELLIQQRSRHKMLWPLYWTNTVCSHPYPNEPYQAAAERRLQEEFGIKAKLKLHHQFIYHEQYKNIGSEHELDAVFTGISDDQPQPDKQEIAGWQYIKLADLKKEIKQHPNKYTPWFKLSLKKLKSSDIFKT
jgi:isopentenyl-diphosphate delta-isomerase